MNDMASGVEIILGGKRFRRTPDREEASGIAEKEINGNQRLTFLSVYIETNHPLLP